jgi:hypothetical protein
LNTALAAVLVDRPDSRTIGILPEHQLVEIANNKRKQEVYQVFFLFLSFSISISILFFKKKKMKCEYLSCFCAI